MRLHSNIIQIPTQIHSALVESGLHHERVTARVTAHGSRSRANAFEIALRAAPGKDRFGKARRNPYTGNYGAPGAPSDWNKAATYDEWGIFIAYLFEMDPDMTFGPYKGHDDFHKQTNYNYRETNYA